MGEPTSTNSPSRRSLPADASPTVRAPSPLQAQMGVARRRQGRLAAALGVVMLAAVVGVYVPARRAIAAARAEAAAVDAQVVADSSRAAALPEVVDTVDDLRRQVDRYRAVRGASDIEQAIVEIGSIKAETSLQNYKFETNELRALPSCLEQRVRITFAADFVDAMSFVRQIEHMPRLVRVRELRMTARRGDTGTPATAGKPDEAATGRVGVEMSLSLFYLADQR